MLGVAVSLTGVLVSAIVVLGVGGVGVMLSGVSVSGDLVLVFSLRVVARVTGLMLSVLAVVDNRGIILVVGNCVMGGLK